jgi:GrpB-like predicted nucleotidyltransferase (UPF0157 family)
MPKLPNTLVVLPYDPNWKTEFERIRNYLMEQIGDLIIEIKHVGSTSVPGLCAKPIIDIIAIMESYAVFPQIVSRLERVGFQHVGDQGIKEREVFKRLIPDDFMDYHFYVCPKDSEENHRQTRFRNALLKNTQIAEEYGKLKARLISEVNGDRVLYTDSKTDFILDVMNRANDDGELKSTSQSAPYYLAYENRYQAVYSSGASIWGHQPDDKMLVAALSEWVNEYDLKGKNVIEYACGEGSVGVILSKLGCIYKGVDIAPSAIKRSKQVLAEYPAATVSVMDMVNERVNGVFDAAIDCMGFHMLITDSDRQKYLMNANAALKPGAPMLFFRQCYSADAYSGEVKSFDEWKAITGADFEKPSMRQVTNNGKEYQVNIPLVPARGKNKADYLAEMTVAGFVVDHFFEMEPSRATMKAASIYVHKVV